MQDTVLSFYMTVRSARVSSKHPASPPKGKRERRKEEKERERESERKKERGGGGRGACISSWYK